ncbi:hypothetical protein GWK47_031316 [Chionoecetes opilio]|uniref:Uncharacterized protein n=1 Tax=Chionoecetes opilio TaxID=41210 RepID=A0A8J4YKU8_CHIOP|nr:hypothetical protein GWK47_031316 [Chionoecetes opilio]
MAAALLCCTEGAQRRLPWLLVTAVRGLTRRRCVQAERKPISEWTPITCAPESVCLYLDYKDKCILLEISVEKHSSFKHVCSKHRTEWCAPSKARCCGDGGVCGTTPTPRLHPAPRRFTTSGLQVWPQLLGKQRGKNVPHDSRYCCVRHGSDSVRQRVAEENRKTRERFAACEVEWQRLVDERLLQPEDLRIHEAHRLAVARGHFTYDDPHTGYRVMTRLRHFLRGSCCGNACRHETYEKVLFQTITVITVTHFMEDRITPCCSLAKPE